MSVIRQANILGQQRFDVPDLKALESSIAHDFDVLAGQIIASGQALVINGFTIPMTGVVGSAASTIQLLVADGVLLHPEATESGSIYSVPSGTLNEVLNPVTNSKIIGDWTPSVVNFVGIDLYRVTDPNSIDTKQFYDPDSQTEVSKTIPISKILEYRIVISVNDFSSRANVLPIAKVTLDANRNVTAVADARPMLGRLGRGGDYPDRLDSYSWPQGREEQTSGVTLFTGGDKSLTSLKTWMDAVMSRIWEIGGGPYWYSPTADRNVNLIWNGPAFASGENFAWDGTNLTWQNLAVVFDNSIGGTTNVISDQTTSLAGLTDLADGECLYVDIVRHQAPVGNIPPQKAALSTLGSSLIPGQRMILAWRTGTRIHTRGWRYPVGTIFQAATQGALGMVRLNTPPGSIPDTLNPVVPVLQNSILMTGLTNGGIALLNTEHALVARSTSSTLAAILSQGTRVGFQGQLLGEDASYSSTLAGLLFSSGYKAATVGDGGNAKMTNSFSTEGAVGVLGVGATGTAAQGFTIAGRGGLFLGGSIDTGTGGNGLYAEGGTGTTGGNGAEFKAGDGTVTDGYAVAGRAVTGSTRPVYRAFPGVVNGPAFDAGAGRLIQVSTPTTGDDASNKQYVDDYTNRRNFIINGGFDLWQRYTFPSTAFTLSVSPVYTADRWVASGTTAYTVDRINESSEGQPIPETVNFLRFKRPSGNTATTNRTLLQEIDRDLVRELRGRFVNISFWAKAGANYSAGSSLLNVALTRGTAVNLNEGAISTNYNGTGTGVTLDVSSVTLSTSWQRFSVTSTVAIDISTRQLALSFFGACVGTAGADDTFDIAGVMMTEGPSATIIQAHRKFERAGRSMSEEIMLCQRYFEKSADLNSLSSNGNQAETGSVVGMGGAATSRFTTTVRFQTRKNNSNGSTDTGAVRRSFVWDGNTSTLGQVLIRGSSVAYTSLFADESKLVIDIQDATPAGISNGDAVVYRWAVDAEIGP